MPSPARPRYGSQSAPPSVPLNAADTTKLSSYLNQVTQAIQTAGPSPAWVRCEIAQITGSGKHRYLTVIESDANGEQIANSRAMVWASFVPKVFGTFEKVTGAPLSAGMNVLLYMKTNFTPRYGFGLVIEAIDPAWTLGDAARALEEARQALKREGLYDLNRCLPAPRDYTRIAVIAPGQSASLADFMTAAGSLAGSGVCDTDVYTAIFEGLDAKQDLIGAMTEIAACPDRYDAACVIRGGGASTSLAWLNHVDIGRRLATMPIPIIVGLGHETDMTLLDNIAYRSLGTPSKAIAFIGNEIYQRARPALEAWRSIPHLVEHHLAEARADLEIFSSEVLQQAHHKLTLAGQDVDAMIRECINLGPYKTLERGYALISHDGHLIKSKQAFDAMPSGQDIELQFTDGKSRVQAGPAEQPAATDTSV